MRLVVGVPVLNQQEVTQQFLDTMRANQTDDTPLVIVDNGSLLPVRDWLKGLTMGDIVIRNGENEGVVKSLNQIYGIAKNYADFIFYTHNDVMIHEKGWDTKIVRLLEAEEERSKVLGYLPKVGVAGFYGAKGIGTLDIYHSEYRMQQMIRLGNVSNCNRMNAAVHGFRPIQGEVEDVAVMDGFSLIVNVDLLKKIDGFDRNYPPHHMYDNDICLESLDKGYRNIVIPMDAEHLGGRTDVGEDWTKNMGMTKQEVHQAAHPVFYNKWSPVNVANGKHKISLPVRV